MLYLNVGVKTVAWPQAGITLQLAPLYRGDKQRFDAMTSTIDKDEQGRALRVVHDTLRYGQLVGRQCIKGWSGVVDPAGVPVPCTPEAIDHFMSIDPAADFVILQVESLAIHLAEERAAAGNV